MASYKIENVGKRTLKKVYTKHIGKGKRDKHLVAEDLKPGESFTVEDLDDKVAEKMARGFEQLQDWQDGAWVHPLKIV